MSLNPYPQDKPVRDAASLSGQVALITGGGGGLGRAFARTLARAGAKVAVIGRTQAALEETVALIESEGGSALAFIADVTDPLRVADVVATVDRQLGPWTFWSITRR